MTAQFHRGSNKLTGAIALLFILGLIGPALVSCQEKQATPTEVKPSKQKANDSSDSDNNADDGATDESDDSSGDDDDGGDTSTPTFDLCKDAKSKISDSTAKTMLDEICGKLSDLRKSGSLYKGGDTTTVNVTEKVDGKQSSFHIISALSVTAKPEAYYDMVRLQYLKPPKFKENFQVSDDVDLTEVNASETNASFRYTNKSSGDAQIDYKAKTDFIVIKAKQAYAFATKLVEPLETIDDLKGLIIINKKSTTETEVFSISDQRYNNQDEPAKMKTEVTRELQNEQKRSWSNGKNAAKAPPLLQGG